MKRFEKLTFQHIIARPVVLKLEHPIVAKIATIKDWPPILIDHHNPMKSLAKVDLSNKGAPYA